MDNDVARWNWLMIQLLSRRMKREEEAKRRSKPYWLADVLTFSRIVIAAFLLAMAYGEWGGIEAGLLVFIFGELTDAFDGMAARKWLYPEDGRYRPWRVYASEIDQFADIALGVALVSFVTLRVDARVGLTTLLLAVAVAVPIQLARDTIEQRWGKKVREAIVLVRRGFYVMTIFGLGLWMLWLTDWSSSWKLAITYSALVLACLLAILKLDRLTQEKTPLVQSNVPEFLKKALEKVEREKCRKEASLY